MVSVNGFFSDDVPEEAAMSFALSGPTLVGFVLGGRCPERPPIVPILYAVRIARPLYDTVLHYVTFTLAGVARFELATPGFGIRCSGQTELRPCIPFRSLQYERRCLLRGVIHQSEDAIDDTVMGDTILVQTETDELNHFSALFGCRHLSSSCIEIGYQMEFPAGSV